MPSGSFWLILPPMTDPLSIVAELEQALERGEFALHYQPQVDPRTGVTAAVEALLRWNHPARGLVAPLSFIPAAERSGLIVEIGAWALRTACRQSRAWREAGFSPVRMAVNLSARQFSDPRLAEKVEDALDDAGLEASDLELEVTESLVADYPEQAGRAARRLRDDGVRLMIDDFGTGYSSLAALKRFPVDGLKIDRAFVQQLPGDRHDVAITKTVLWLAGELSLDTVAEGVETREQRDYLARLGCGLVQGYLVGAPQPPERVARLLGERLPAQA
jgi:EAL domain-containing protein (putative c-di-GMP-specific phosphodiesterase class I)